ncbi:AMP-activated protein kinase, glycogen-binding domain containing protein [Parasponia andersonii]|uniref:AMP-activated protein kinase, glycogen-binding domain containing protein n=1 Tax=Parasponia andersonii TaxID=3476 RepID=A0A2P5BJT0_PARAD|nr:AMP-activated protein kinase, glycogen-binding domain containing protein [Parasponia andersonii]
MATLSHFPSFSSLYPHKLFFLNQRKQQELKLGWCTQQNPPHKRCRFRASSTKKSRKVKDNAELCNEIREFMATVGLPESHVPTMKDFSQHGRSDLAYIVRRRGYKRIGELLASTIETDVDGSVLENRETKNKDAVVDPEVEDEEVSVMVGDFPSSTEVSVMRNSSGSLVMDTDTNSDDNCHVPVEASADFSLQETASYSLEGDNEEVNVLVGHFPSSFEVSVVENCSGSLVIDTSTDSDDNSYVPVESSANFSLEETSSHSLEGDNEKGYDMDEDGSSAIEVSSIEIHLASSSVGTAFNSGNHNQEEPLETSTNMSNSQVANYSSQETAFSSLDGDSEKSYNMGEDGSLRTIVSSTENHLASSNIGPAFNSGDHNQEKPLESSTNMSFGEKDLNGEDEMVNMAVESAHGLPVEGQFLQSAQYGDNTMVKEVSSATEVLITENHLSSSNIDPDFSSDEHGSVPVELSALSLEEKVANFMHYGHLGTVEDDSFGIFYESGIEEGKGYMECVDAEVQSVTSTSEHLENVLSGDTAVTPNGSASKSNQVVPAGAGNPPYRDENLSAEGESTQLNEDLDIKTTKKVNHVEISQLKLMLHQKELELSRLKEEIEKEKNALSVLQARADTEISKAQQLISEKDAELQSAEETLSGLVEIQIQYCGDGEIVEVTGSFNGWHHYIKMDAQPLSSLTDPVGSRKSRLWSTVLWLYPGIYEIKFIVDGHWKIDPDRESVNHGVICNNILRVDG